jgi:hypothetical protein
MHAALLCSSIALVLELIVTVSRLGVNTYVRPPQSGGPDYKVELGRFDSRVSTCSSVVIPHGTFDLDQLNGFFSSLGLNQTDMIALSGTCQRARVHACIYKCVSYIS